MWAVHSSFFSLYPHKIISKICNLLHKESSQFKQILLGKNMSNYNPENHLIRIRPMAKTMLGNPSNSTIYRWIRNEKFPHPIKLSSSCSAWKVSEVRTWIESRERGARLGGS
jgi:prophage regulatory protein